MMKRTMRVFYYFIISAMLLLLERSMIRCCLSLWFTAVRHFAYISFFLWKFVVGVNLSTHCTFSAKWYGTAYTMIKHKIIFRNISWKICTLFSFIIYTWLFFRIRILYDLNYFRRCRTCVDVRCIFAIL